MTKTSSTTPATPIRIIRITHYPDTPINVAATGDVLELPSLAALRDHILDTASDRQEKGASGYWVAAPVYGTRSNRNTRPTRVIALDWDDTAQPPTADHPALRALRYFAHTTDSHTPDAPRWRVWVELDREYAVDEVGRAQSPIDGVYLRAASQPAFVPTRGDDLEWVDATSVEREPLVLERWTTASAATTPAPVAAVAEPRQPTLASTHALVARWLSRPEGTNRLAGAVGAVLAAWGWSDESIGAWLTNLLNRADPRIAKHVDDAVRAARTRRAGGTVPGLPTLETELGVPFLAEASAAFVASVVDAYTPADGPEVDQNGWVTAAAIAAWVPPPVEWLVEGLALAPGAPVLLSGYGGSGKTTLAQHLAVCVAASGPQPQSVFGALTVARPGPVTHIDYEQGIELTARRYRDLGLTADAALRFRAPPTGMPGLVGDAAARRWLADAAVGQRLVLVDSLIAGIGTALDDENAAGVREPLDWLGRVSIDTGAVVLVIHHSRKTQRGGDPRQTARGSSAITDAVSVHLNYERTADGGGAVLRAAKLRRSPPAGMLAGLLGDGVRITPELTLGRAAADATSDLSDAEYQVDPEWLDRVTSTVLRAVADGGYLKTADVARALGVDPQGGSPGWRSVRDALAAAAERGDLVQAGTEGSPNWYAPGGTSQRRRARVY